MGWHRTHKNRAYSSVPPMSYPFECEGNQQWLITAEKSSAKAFCTFRLYFKRNKCVRSIRFSRRCFNLSNEVLQFYSVVSAKLRNRRIINFCLQFVPSPQNNVRTKIWTMRAARRLHEMRAFVYRYFQMHQLENNEIIQYILLPHINVNPEWIISFPFAQSRHGAVEM